MNISMESVKSLLIKMYYNESYLSSATAFIAISPSGPILLTNRHNVTGKNNLTGECLSTLGAVPNKIEIYHNKVHELGSNITKVENLYRDIDNFDEPLWIEHPEWNSSVDFVALKLTSLEDVEIYPYNLDEGKHMIIGVAEAVSVVGFPFGIEVGSNTAIWATGFIASEPELNYNDLPLFLIDCRSRQGQSGSAVVAYRPDGSFNMPGGFAITGAPVTKFLGIYSGRINSESDIGLVWKASAIKELVDSI